MGASAAYHLAELGITDVLVLDQGPLFETGGSTSHAPGLVFQTNGSRTMCRLAQYSVDLTGLESTDGPAWYGVGGIEVATTPERVAGAEAAPGLRARLRDRGTRAAHARGDGRADPDRSIPSTILGSYLVPSDGIAKGVRVAAALARRRPKRKGVAFEGGVRVTGFDIREGRVHGVHTDRGDVECEQVLVCAGIWGPTIGRMAGVPIPLAVVQHQLVWTHPLPELAADAAEEVVHPILRHQDVSLYFRQRGDRYALGNYRHEPILFEPDDLRPYRDGEPQPSVEPFTPEHFEVAYEESTSLLPPVKDMLDETTAINGMFSFTPDTGSVVGESADVRGFWICEAVWVTHAGGMGRMAAEWIAAGEPSMDMAEADANRFYPFMTTKPYVRARGAQQYREVYDILHPLQQMTHPRELRLTPVLRAPRGARRRVLLGRRVGAPAMVRGEPRADRCALGVARPAGRPTNWSPGVGRRAPGDARARRAVRHHAVREVRRHRPGCARVPRARLREPDRPSRRDGRLHRRCSTPSGGIRCDLTVTRMDEDRFRVVTGGGSGQHDLAWLRAQRPRGRTREPSPCAPARCSRSASGARRRATSSQAVTDADVSNEAFPYMTARYLNVGEVDPVSTQRISYAGELGWELYGPIAMGDARLGPAVGGRPRARPGRGRAAARSTRSVWRRATGCGGRTSTPSTTRSRPASASPSGWTRASSRGGTPCSGSSSAARREKLACMTFDDPTRVVMGKEPIWHDGRVVGVRHERRLRLLGRPRDRLRLPPGRAGRGGDTGRSRILRRSAARPPSPPSRCGIPKGERLRA